MAGYLGSDFDPSAPADTADASGAASQMRDIKQRIKTFLAICFNLESGQPKDGVIPGSALETVTSVTPGAYTLASITVDAKGRVTAAASGSAGSSKPSSQVEDPAHGGTGLSTAPSAGQILIGTAAGGYALAVLAAVAGKGVIVNSSSGAITLQVDPSYFPSIPFFASASLTAAAAGTPVELLPDFASGDLAGRKCYIEGFMIRVDGATAWTGVTNVKIRDNNSTPVDFITVLTAALTANARVGMWSSNVTLEDALSRATGGTASKGLRIVADTNGTAGSTIIASVWGVYR